MLKQLLLLILFFSTAFAVATEINFSSGEKQNTLIELYTSEGCNSCPPAESWLNNFKDKKNLFRRNIPLAFHVDYFNDAGWEDKYAKASFSHRQRQQSEEGYLPAVYTPSILINSVEYRLGWQDKHGKPAFKQKQAKRPKHNSFFLSTYSQGIWFDSEGNSAPYRHWLESLDKPRQIVGRLSAYLVDSLLHINFTNQTQLKQFKLNVALLGMGLSSVVEAGENKGKTLYHDFVVLSHHIYEQKQQDKQNQQWQIALPNTTVLASKYALTIWLTPKHSLSMVQGTGMWLADDVAVFTKKQN